MANRYHVQTNLNQNKKSRRYKRGLILVSVFSALFLLLAFGVVPFLSSLFLGVFGLFFYAACLGLVAYGLLEMFEKDIFVEKMEIFFMFIWLIVFVAILHLTSTISIVNTTFSTYISQVYASKLTAGGVLFSLLVYPINAVTHTVASYILYAVFLIVLSTVIAEKLVANKQFKKLNMPKPTFSDSVQQKENIANPAHEEEEEVIIKDDEVLNDEPVQTIVLNQEEKNKARQILGLTEKDKEVNKSILQNSKGVIDGVRPNIFVSPQTQEHFETNPDENSGARPPKFVHQEFGIKQKPNEETEKPKKELSDSDRKNLEFLRNSLGGDLKKRQLDELKPFVKTTRSREAMQDVDELLNESEETEKTKPLYDPELTAKNYQQKGYGEAQPTQPTEKFNIPANQQNGLENDQNVFNVEDEVEQDVFKEINTFSKPEIVHVAPPKPKQMKVHIPYVKPPLDLLKVYEPSVTETQEDYSLKAQMLEQTLSSFKIPASVVSVIKGPAFTRFEMQMPSGIPVKRVMGYIDDIAMILESQGAVRIEIPIPGKNAFGVEVPNETVDIVGLKDILESYAFQGSKSLLTFSLGKDITGECKVARLDKMPHLLVAGATGSGKSVCLNSLIISMVYKSSPDDLRIILIDPKRVEFTLYNGLPHLLVPNVITEPDKAICSFNWTIDEMERRFSLFSKYRVRNLDEYNSIAEVKSGLEEKLPYIIIIVDELADLMLLNKKDVEEKIIRIAQKSRAAGIHLVLATQRPSVNVITGIIKANLPSRIAFAVTSNPDSRTILDQGGAEKLLGKGDMLYSPIESPDPIRLQGSFISNEEVGKVVEFIKANNDSDFDSDIEDKMFNKKQYGFDAGSNANDYDPLLKDAIRNFIRSNSASISRLQRLFGIGFQRAGKIVDQLENLGYISEKDTSNNRKIFMTQQEFEEHFGEDL